LSIRFFLLINGATRTSIFYVFVLLLYVRREKRVFLSFLPLLPCSAGHLTELLQQVVGVLWILRNHRTQRQARAIL
jgi:hypothetical protein